MKKLHFIPLMLCLVAMLFVSCEEKKPVIKPDNSQLGQPLGNTEYNIWKQNWLADGPAYLQANDSLEYFDMPLIDLSLIVGEYPQNQLNTAKARFQLGLNKSVSPPALHLLVVGVTDKGVEMLDNSKGQYAYDLTYPCPKYCNPPRGD